jgi:DNA mismatch repair protein MutS2
MNETARLDLDAESRHALEFDALLELVAAEASTAAGRRVVLDLAPFCDAELLARETGLVSETRDRCMRGTAWVPAGLPDVRPACRLLEVADARFEPGDLRDLALVLDAVTRLRRDVRAADAGYERLREFVARLPDLSAESAPILSGVEPGGKITDNASRRLADCRTRLTRLAGRLRRRLESLLRDPQMVGAIQDEFVTQRNGRYVIPVRTDAPHPVHGIVHATSASGATRFIEPLDSVESNNELVQLAEQEKEEEERIVREWANALRERLAEVRFALDRLALLDGVQARARFAERASAVESRVVDGGPIRLTGLRHPLLEHHLRASGGACVPLDLELDPADRVLVVSGPNTGGKTVALKSIGLAVLMAQSGIPVTAREAVLPRYSQVRADVGDRQSIEADLSTFSGHMTAIADALAQRRAPALFLFDEIGGGTDPAEGVALAQAVLEDLSGEGVTVVATTHQNALKRWAFGAAEAASAAMEFDPRTLRPTYRVLPNVVGQSAALDIAISCGLEPRVAERARTLLGSEAGRSEAYMNRLREELADVERRRLELEEAKRALQAEQAADEARRRAAEGRQREQSARALDRELVSFRKQVRRSLEAITDAAARRKAERVAHASERRLKAQRERVASGPRSDDDAAAWAVVDRPEAGTRVHVLSLKQPGTVQRVSGKRVEVLVGRMTVSVAPDDLRVPPTAESAPPRTQPAAPARSLEVGAPRELKLIGMRVEEALSAVDRGLDRALVDGLQELRLIHGHGTGRLRAAIRDFLRHHPSVEKSRGGDEHEGGEAVTVAVLR